MKYRHRNASSIVLNIYIYIQAVTVNSSTLKTIRNIPSIKCYIKKKQALMVSKKVKNPKMQYCIALVLLQFKKKTSIILKTRSSSTIQKRALMLFTRQTQPFLERG